MLEIYNINGYVMWNILPNSIERQCILYRNGMEINPEEDEADDIAGPFLTFVLANLPSENRSVYLKNMPLWLSRNQK